MYLSNIFYLVIFPLPAVDHPVCPGVGAPVPVIEPVVIGFHVSEHVSVVARHVSAEIILIQGVDSQEAGVIGAGQTRGYEERQCIVYRSTESLLTCSYLNLTVVQQAAALLLS